MAADRGGGGFAPAPLAFRQSAEVFGRLTRLAEALVPSSHAQITLLTDGKPWRSNDPKGALGERATLTEMAMAARQVVWIPDASRHKSFRETRIVVGRPHVRLLVAAPIHLPDGTIPGALCLGAPAVRDFDAGLAERLADVAALVADEWRRAQAARAQEASQKEREAFGQILGSIIDSAPLSILMLDRDLRILGASRRWLQARGLRRRDAVGRMLAEVMPQASEWGEVFDRCLTGETYRSDRAALSNADGTVGWWRTEVTPWPDPRGGVGGLIVSSHEITDMVEALERVERSEERLKLAMEIADVHVWEMDYARRQLIKAGVEDTFFTQPKTYQELLTDIWASIDARDRPAAMAAWERSQRDGTPYRPEYRVVRGDRREVWAQCAVRLITDETGRVVRMVGAMQNVTERKRAELALVKAKEEAEAATHAKSAFLATMSHEIRTPLNGVLGMAQAMARDELSDRQRARLDVVRQSGEALLAILNDVLDLSKIEAGKLELEQSEFDLAELARGAHATFAATAQAKGLGFRLTVTPAARGVYLGDSVRVRQILYNLVSNALKFTEQGFVRVTVGRRRERLVLKVADSGIGVAPEKLVNLFQKFEQADASTTRRFGGTGLGLAICRDLAELMGGAISASSTPGQGATFTVELPVAKLADAPPASRHVGRGEAAVIPEGRPLRVLAAEDNPMNQLVLKTLLGQAGIEPVLVPDGRAAIEAWAQAPWDVILMDVQMPVMDGPTATAEIRAREAAEARPRTPIVALTANAMAHQAAEYRAAGMDDIVPKPIEASRLFEAIVAALDSGRGDAAAAA